MRFPDDPATNGAGERRTRHLPGPPPCSSSGRLELTPRSGRLVLAARDAISDIWSLDLDGPSRPGTGGGAHSTWCGRARHGAQQQVDLLFSSSNTLRDSVYMLDRTTGQEEALTAQRLLQPSTRVQPSADGRRLVCARHRGTGAPIGYIVDPVAPGPRRHHGRHGSRLSSSPSSPSALLGRRCSDRALVLKASRAAARVTVPVPDSIVVISFAVADGLLLRGRRVATTSAGDVDERSHRRRCASSAPEEDEPVPACRLGRLRAPATGGAVRVAHLLDPGRASTSPELGSRRRSSPGSRRYRDAPAPSVSRMSPPDQLMSVSHRGLCRIRVPRSVRLRSALGHGGDLPRGRVAEQHIH